MMLYHKEPKFMGCEECGIEIGSHKKLRLHNKKTHNRPSIKCIICKRTLADNYQLERHRRIFHEEDTTRIECMICGKISTGHQRFKSFENHACEGDKDTNKKKVLSWSKNVTRETLIPGKRDKYTQTEPDTASQVVLASEITMEPYQPEQGTSRQTAENTHLLSPHLTSSESSDPEMDIFTFTTIQTEFSDPEGDWHRQFTHHGNEPNNNID